MKITNNIAFSEQATILYNFLLSDLPEGSAPAGTQEVQGVYASFDNLDGQFGDGWDAKYPEIYAKVKEFVNENKAYQEETGKVRVYGEEQEVSYFLGLSDVFEHAGV